MYFHRSILAKYNHIVMSLLSVWAKHITKVCFKEEVSRDTQQRALGHGISGNYWVSQALSLQDCLTLWTHCPSIPGMQLITQLPHKGVYQSGWYQMIGCQRKLFGSMILKDKWSRGDSRRLWKGWSRDVVLTPTTWLCVNYSSQISKRRWIPSQFVSHNMPTCPEDGVWGIPQGQLRKRAADNRQQSVRSRWILLFSTSLCRIQWGCL